MPVGIAPSGGRAVPSLMAVRATDDGTVRVASATQDIGTGMYTILAQLASQKTGVALEKVEVDLGDTSLPEGPLSHLLTDSFAGCNGSRWVGVDSRIM